MTKKIYVLITLLCCISLFVSMANAQKATVRATIQPVEIVIGQQSTINLEIISPKGRNIVLPIYADTLVSGLEIVDIPKADTVYANDVMTITQKYIVTSFDSALYHISHIPIVDGVDTVVSNGFGLKVMSPPLSDATMNYLDELNTNPQDSIDLDKLAVFDIKGVQEPPFVWQDYIWYALLILGFLIAIAAIVVAVYMYRKKRKQGYFFKPKVVAPPHVIALNALNQVKEQKMWQQGREKEYFTELTDILRAYIEKRYYLNAFEMTSDEILAMTKNIVETESSCESLRQVLKLADLVKFAKYTPLPDENDLSMVNSILFVNQTKKEEPEVDPSSAKVSSHSNNDNDRSDDEDSIDWTIPESDKIE